ncbi:MAG: pstA [Thermoleophilia bacterium]|nr:pstA [Thermoleophilia bacterium]MCZ4496970.1 pstA [Thermoleophilia bacterium]
MSTLTPTAGSAVRGRRLERRPRELAFMSLLLFGLLVGLVTLLTLVIDVAIDGVPSLSMEFLTNLDSRFAERAGIYPALIGTLWLMFLVALFTLPLGVGAAVYLHEFAPKGRATRFIDLNIANLAAVPSVVYGLLGLAVFVRGAELGRSVLAGALTLTLLLLPMVVVASREALRGVPDSIRQASYGVGATRVQTVRSQVLPAAIPGIMTGMILGLSRAIGETAPLITLGALTYVSFVPSNPMDRFTAMPIQIFNWTSRPQEEFQHVAAAGILLLLGVLLGMNALAIWIRSRYERSW